MMNVLNDVFSDYLKSKDLKTVPGKNVTPALKSLREDLPEIFRRTVKATGLHENEYLVKGSCGQTNFSMAAIPWVALFKKSITRKATDGYYIVLLFAEDMSRAYLTFNQGYTRFEEIYKNPVLARKKLKDCANAFQRLEVCPQGFTINLISLSADGNLGKGYEAGSIFSKEYLATDALSERALEADLTLLIALYEKASKVFNSSLLELDILLTDRDYQDAVNAINDDLDGDDEPLQPKARPTQGRANSALKFLRSPIVARRALNKANGKCALADVETPHTSFVSRSKGANFVEAHHLIPFSQQKNFSNSLDVEQNIIALCPNCHKKLHYATAAQINEHLKFLLDKRSSLLEKRGVHVTLSELKSMYKSLEEDD